MQANTHVELALFDVSGGRVATLVDGVQPAGRHTAYWDGRMNSGVEVASGIYFYRLRVGDRQRARKLLLLR